ncbi:MAG: GntR family transcriptional regulator, partial [Actinomycetales bacterium]|nr:GntR family transcriptional regulator [Candidatus Phosphoribacter baldrii]
KASMRPDEIASAVRRAVLRRVIGQASHRQEARQAVWGRRIPLREALRTWSVEGLIIIKPGLGAIVTELDPAAVDELYGLRLRLEPPLASDIVEHVRRSDIAELRRMSERLVDVMEEQSESWSSTAYAFNRRLYEVSARHLRCGWSSKYLTSSSPTHGCMPRSPERATTRRRSPAPWSGLWRGATPSR